MKIQERMKNDINKIRGKYRNMYKGNKEVSTTQINKFSLEINSEAFLLKDRCGKIMKFNDKIKQKYQYREKTRRLDIAECKRMIAKSRK